MGNFKFSSLYFSGHHNFYKLAHLLQSGKNGPRNSAPIWTSKSSWDLTKATTTRTASKDIQFLKLQYR